MPEPQKTPTIIYIDGILKIKDGFYFGSTGGIEIAENATLSFGRNFNATAKCTIICRNNISFGEDVLVSWNTLFMNSDQHMITKDSKNNEMQNYDGTIKIGDHVWIASKVSILKNTVIPNGCVIGCSTMLHGVYYQERTLIAGNPAKICKEDIVWKHERPDTHP